MLGFYWPKDVECSNIVVIASTFNQVSLILLKNLWKTSSLLKQIHWAITKNLEFSEITYKWRPLSKRFSRLSISRACTIFGISSSCMTLQLTFVKSAYRSSRWISMNARECVQNYTTALWNYSSNVILFDPLTCTTCFWKGVKFLLSIFIYYFFIIVIDVFIYFY